MVRKMGKRQRADAHRFVCSECHKLFESTRKDAQTCGPTCRQRKRRTLFRQAALSKHNPRAKGGQRRG